MTPEQRKYMEEVERQWDRESWYRHPDGRPDWLAIEGLAMMAVLAVGIVAMFVGAFVR